MNSLVAYGSSSSSSSTDDDDLTERLRELEGRLLDCFQATPKCDVQRSLVKALTVKVPGKDQILTINGKKICWSYRKGRCRFGHNCKYAHDTDVQKSSEELEADKKKTKVIVCEESGTNSAAPPPIIADAKDLASDETMDGGIKRKLKRPGLSQGLIPGKKVLKMYQDQKIKDEKK
ncbi:hypothetical protein EVAR_29790_1 [Eumeta japonica]|uniref:C3H1-type domain-containing protein n=1 Tax=Eumeta variegata TaxID=151549 RepID=A0A4C1XMH1_EUMVA|nr:hypothetical protein EVAR_29790_1 [Eumeta japonica]